MEGTLSTAGAQDRDRAHEAGPLPGRKLGSEEEDALELRLLQDGGWET